MHHPFPRQAPTTHLPSTVHFQAAGKSSQPRPRARGQESRTGIQQESPTRVTFKVRAMSAATSCRVQPGPAKGTSRATSKVQPTSRQSHESSRRHIESSRVVPSRCINRRCVDRRRAHRWWAPLWCESLMGGLGCHRGRRPVYPVPCTPERLRSAPCRYMCI